MKKLLLKILIVLCMIFSVDYATSFASDTPNYTYLNGSSIIYELKHKSALESINNNWYSPLAQKYDNTYVKVHSLVTDKYTLPNGEFCIVLDSYTSKQQSGNWYRKEDYKIKAFIPRNRYDIYSSINKGVWVDAYGIANIDFIWNGGHINKHDQKSLSGLANFQGNGRGSHEYTFEIKNAWVTNSF